MANQDDSLGSGGLSSPTLSEAASGLPTEHDAASNKVHATAKQIQRHFPTVPLTNSTTLKKNMADPVTMHGLVLVDVRTADEVAVSAIPGSITMAEFEAHKAAHKGKTVVCYCTVGYRSSSAAAKLKEQGFEAKNLEGGIVRWTQKRLPLVVRSGEGPAAGEETTRVHVYGKQWVPLVPDSYEAVAFKDPMLKMIRSLLPRWLGGK